MNERENQKNHQPRLGIDIGRVIICPAGANGKEDTSFLGSTDAEAMETPPSPGALAVIKALVERFEGRVWLVSKCGSRIERRSRSWLRYQRFHEQTGLPRDHLRFCKKRPDKAIHCRRLGLTHFIDDRLDVLRHLRDVTPFLFLFGYQKPRTVTPAWVEPVSDWRVVRRVLLT